jgi:polyisoprenoid-binding protein YceI
MRYALPICLIMVSASAAMAEPVTYNVDPQHTHPSFEADHMGGLSTWRGTFKKTTGKITLDKSVNSGTVLVSINVASIDFGQDELSKEARGPEMFDSAKYPTATYKGTLGDFKDGAPTTVTGELTLHGVTKPLTLSIDSFKCMMHPMLKQEVCGADALGTFNRADFGVNYGQDYGFNQQVRLRIQVEAIKAS